MLKGGDQYIGYRKGQKKPKLQSERQGALIWANVLDIEEGQALAPDMTHSTFKDWRFIYRRLIVEEKKPTYRLIEHGEVLEASDEFNAYVEQGNRTDVNSEFDWSPVLGSDVGQKLTKEHTVYRYGSWYFQYRRKLGPDEEAEQFQANDEKPKKPEEPEKENTFYLELKEGTILQSGDELTRVDKDSGWTPITEEEVGNPLTAEMIDDVYGIPTWKYRRSMCGTVRTYHQEIIRLMDTVNEPDMVNHPPHYTQHASGIECIEVTEHMGFCLGNAVKYLWRADLKHDTIEDMEKAVWYIKREIDRRKLQ